MKSPANDERLELPLYGVAEAALYLRVPITTLEYWAFGRGRVLPLICVARKSPRAFSFMNLLECHMLASMRALYDLRLPKIRRAVAHLNKTSRFKHPLIEEPLFTNRVDVLIKEIDKFINLSRGGQLAIPEIVEAHLERVEYDKSLGVFRFYPFVRERSSTEPKFIVIDPGLGFGKPVISGTGISTAVIASRFNARESMPDLAKEYGLEEKQIEEAIRWETRAVAA
ncbi:MAG TPA: DUF433 domain-containing protein [Candidatus Sulfotelmatobacter sp.]|nr:DUF433 domain-containing protein [Candidatus Sulfotelmatobacter sp.]